MSSRKTGIILHTFDHTKSNWRHAMWGKPTEPGRIPTAVAAALETGASLLLVFTDIISVDRKNEGVMIRDSLFNHIEELPLYAESLPILKECSLVQIRDTMKQIFLLSDVHIVNTADEIAAVPSIFAGRGLESAIFVSNFDHASRVAQLIGTIWRDKGIVRPVAYICPAASLYSACSMQEVVVFEPPIIQSLGCDPRLLLKLMGNPDALARLQALLKEFDV